MHLAMWPFTLRRKQRPPISENWRSGDIAQCIRDDWTTPPHKAPRVGTRCIVADVKPGRSLYRGELGWCLSLIGYPGRWDETAFRKIVPPRRREQQVEREAAPVGGDRV